MDGDPNKRTDKCGNPFPDVCTPQTVRTPICYLTPSLEAQGLTTGLPGFLVIAIQADCSGVVQSIENILGNIVNTAFQVPCPDSLGPGGFGEGGGPGPGVPDQGGS